MSYKDHCDNTSHPGITEEELLRYFKNLGTKGEKISSVQIFQYGLFPILEKVGLWHEYVIIKSTNYYWSFEKDRTGLHVQRSSKEADVKEKHDENNQQLRVDPEARGRIDVDYEDTIYNGIQWIINREELDNTYHYWSSNCQIFASLFYEAIARRKNRRLDNTW